MRKPWDHLFLTLHGIAVLTITVIIVMTRYVADYQDLLRRTTLENGLFELASVAVLLMLSFFCCFISYQNRRSKFLSKSQSGLFLLMAILGFVAAMEEISWGQQFFGFRSGEFFNAHNLQKETNLHNFMPAMWLSTAINVVVYGCFIVLPLLYYCQFKNFPLNKLLSAIPNAYWPSPDVILIMIYSSSLHHYFSPVTWSDTAALLLSLTILVGYWWRRKPQADGLFTLNVWVVVACSACYAMSYQIFSQYNLQYEIREFVVVYGVFYWMVDWSLRMKNGFPAWIDEQGGN